MIADGGVAAGTEQFANALDGGVKATTEQGFSGIFDVLVADSGTGHVREPG